MDHPPGYLGSFRRALKYLRPQRKRIVFAVICSIGLALSFAAGLGTMVPVLRLLISDEGPRTSLYRISAELKFALALRPYNPDKHGKLTATPPPSGLVITADQADRLSPEGPGAGSVILPADDSIQTPLEFYEVLAQADSAVPIQWYAGAQGNQLQEATLTPAANTLKTRWACGLLNSVGQLFPVANTIRAKRTTLLIVLSGVLGIVIISATLRFLAEYTVFIISNRSVMDLRRDMYRTVLSLPMSWFGKRLSETMSRVVTDFRDVERGYRALFGRMLTEPIKVVVLFLFALVLDWRITLFALIAGPLAGLLLARIGKKIRKANRKMLAAFAQMLGVINATLAGMKIVRGYNQQVFERRRMWRQERVLLKQMLKIGRLEAMSSPLLEVLGVMVAMLGVVYLAEYVFSGQLAPESFILLAGCLAALFDSAKKVAEVYPRLARADGAAQRVFELIDQPTETQRTPSRAILPRLQQHIEFRQVSYRYPESAAPALQDISLMIHKGEKFALVGPNGSGKTTLISLLERFATEYYGQILFDGREIREYSIASLRSQISLITQDAVVFAVSAYENVAYGMPAATRPQVIAAAEKAHAHEFIERLPQGYDTVLGEFGATLSGGERQRLSLARAILRDAPIFILDEATSQIDTDSERKIQQATTEFMQNRTSIVIAHRISTITDADHIAVLDQGRVVDVADHETLLGRCELYNSLYTAHGGTA